MTASIAWLNASGTCLAFVQLVHCLSTLFVLERLCAPSPGPALRASIISLLFASPPSLVCLFLVRWPWSGDKRGIWQTGTLWASTKRQRSICPNTWRKAYVLLRWASHSAQTSLQVGVKYILSCKDDCNFSQLLWGWKAILFLCNFYLFIVFVTPWNISTFKKLIYHTRGQKDWWPGRALKISFLYAFIF